MIINRQTRIFAISHVRIGKLPLARSVRKSIRSTGIHIVFEVLNRIRPRDRDVGLGGHAGARQPLCLRILTSRGEGYEWDHRQVVESADVEVIGACARRIQIQDHIQVVVSVWIQEGVGNVISNVVAGCLSPLSQR